MECDPPRGRRIVLFDVDAQRGKIGDRLRSPDCAHGPFALGGGFSSSVPHELTQAVTDSCGTPSPRSSEAMARLMPVTCHSLTSRYSLIATAARKDRLRPVILASRSSRLLTPASTLTVNVVEPILSACLSSIVYKIAQKPKIRNRTCRANRRNRYARVLLWRKLSPFTAIEPVRSVEPFPIAVVTKHAASKTGVGALMSRHPIVSARCLKS